MTLVSTARVATTHPTVYLRQLCGHFAEASQRHGDQEFDVSFDDHHGFVDLRPVVDGACRLDAGEEGVLAIEAIAADQAALGRVQRIVARHVERFGRSDALTVDWADAAEQPSTG